MSVIERHPFIYKEVVEFLGDAAAITKDSWLYNENSEIEILLQSMSGKSRKTLLCQNNALIGRLLRKVHGVISDLPKSIRGAMGVIGNSITLIDLNHLRLSEENLRRIFVFFPSLQNLSFKVCGLERSHLQIIAAHARALEELVLDDNPLVTDEGIIELCNSSLQKTLTRLSLYNCGISGNPLKTVAKLPKLTRFIMNEPDDSLLITLDRFSQLESLVLYNCERITDKTISQLKYPNLKVLYHAMCEFS